MLANNSNYKIEPNKCIIEDLEILAFESEEQQRLYTIWHEALVDRRRELDAETERERQIIRNEIARKNRQLIVTVPSEELKRLCNGAGSKNSNKSSPKTTATSKNAAATRIPSTPVDDTLAVKAAASAATVGRDGGLNQQVQAKLSHQTSRSSQLTSQQQQSNQSRVSQQTHNGLGCHNQQQSRTSFSSRPVQSNGLPNGLPNGLTILNSAYYNTQSTKHVMRYKLTKLYNKYRGRQLRRNFVIEKQRNSKIEAEISRSYLNPWLTYTALQALRLPETNVNTLNTTTNNNTKILTPMAQQPSACSITKKFKTSSKKQHHQQQQTKAQAQSLTSPQSTQNPPMHLVYIDPGNIITYSNRINPQQVAEYKQKSHLLPSSATSKKSSAASYDVYEIMEVLANTNKTNVTITRNANRPSHGGASTASIYSHSVNANTPGIVSTQLHLQARSYRDSMRKFYTEEVQRMEQQRDELETEPDYEELISRYLKI